MAKQPNPQLNYEHVQADDNMSPEVLKISKLPQKAETKKWLDVQRLQLNPKLCRHMSPAVFKFPRLPQNAKTPKLVKHPNPTAKP